MEEYLNSLTRQELISIFKIFGSRKFNNKLKNEDMIRDLVDSGIISNEEIELLREGVEVESNEQLRSVADNAAIIRESNEKLNKSMGELSSSEEKEDKKGEEKEIVSEKVKQIRTINELVARNRKLASETVVVTVTPLDPTDLGLEKKAEVISFNNQYFAKSVVVPFYVPCEIPRVIYNVLKEARYRTSTALDPNATPNKTLRRAYMTPKYSLQLHAKKDI